MAEKVEGVVQKGWGYELIWANKETYCGKILVFQTIGNKTSMHFHKNKTKTWFINNGKFILRYIDTTTGTLMQKEMADGDTWTVYPLMPCQLETLEDGSSITEVSDFNDETDYFCVIQGDTQVNI